MATDHTFLRTANYELDDESEALISRSTWSLKLSGLIAGVLLVIGRSASYGNITWTPAFHSASAPLTVIFSTSKSPAPAPPIPKTLPGVDPAAISKRSAASEIITFSPGRSATDDTQEDTSHGSAATTNDSHPQTSGSVVSAASNQASTTTAPQTGTSAAATAVETTGSTGSAASH
ncbi:MAG TPA: hypothetical protein VIN39_01595, partial [Candidatus Dormibacteraeota bacterium]